MSKVMVGSVCIGFVTKPLEMGEWVASRVAVGGTVIVGSSHTQEGALTLLGRSLIAKSLDDGGLSATQRDGLRDLMAQLDAMGMKDLSRIIMEVLR